MKPKGQAKYVRFPVELDKGASIELDASPRIRAAVEELKSDMTLYAGVRFAQVLAAVYKQGLRDGRREVMEAIQSATKDLKYLPPGRPVKRKRGAAATRSIK